MKKIGVILLSIIVSLGAACFDASAQTTVVAPQPKKTKEKIHEVGKMYRDGFGVATDIDKARYWLEKASKNHYVSASDAERDLKRLSK